jgi:hypothetical protein
MKSMKMIARQRLLVSAINTALERGLIPLECEPLVPVAFEYELAGLPILAVAYDAGSYEVALNVIACPTDDAPRAASDLMHDGWYEFGAAVTGGWLERQNGKYLHTGFRYRGSREVTRQLASAKVRANGFGTETPRSYRRSAVATGMPAPV